MASLGLTPLPITFVTKDGKELGGPLGGKGVYNIVYFFRRADVSPNPGDFDLGIDEHIGTSLLAVASPALTFAGPPETWADHIKLSVTNETGVHEALGYPNSQGFLSDVRSRLNCDSFEDAGIKADTLFLPFVSALSFKADVPLMVSHRIIVEETTGTIQRTITPGYPASQLPMEAGRT